MDSGQELWESTPTASSPQLAFVQLYADCTGCKLLRRSPKYAHHVGAVESHDQGSGHGLFCHSTGT